MTLRHSKSIPVRAPRFTFTNVPRHWWGNNRLGTHAVNALSLIFPAGERFFIRSVRRYQDVIERDPELAARVKGFVGQEGRHGHAHDRFNRMLEEHGFDLVRFHELYERLAYGTIEPLTPPVLRLATTVALEHLTATLAEVALGTELLAGADPRVVELLKWHAAEEIEHKSVAFDVLAQVDPRHSIRMAGLAIAALTLGGFWALALATLLDQERKNGAARSSVRSEPLRFAQHTAAVRRVLATALREYLRRDFHPDRFDNSRLAGEHIASMELVTA